MSALPLQFGGSFPLPINGGGITGSLAGALFGKRKGRTPKAKKPSKISQPADHSAAARQSAAKANARSARAEPMVEKRSDEQLLAAYIDGERDAFPILMGRYADELVHFLTRFLGSRPAADDVFQETFLQVHLSAETFDTERRFKPWLFTIAANKARDYHRKHSRTAAASLSASIDSSGEGERFVDLLEADVPNPDSPLLDAERSRLVKGVIDAMPLHLREILLLSYFQKLSYNQIADSLEIPLGTVKSRLHTAVAAFARGWQVARGADEDGQPVETRDRPSDGLENRRRASDRDGGSA